MDRAELAMECVAVEKAGGSVRDFLAERGCISPWGTWYRLQKEELHRSESQITLGKGDENKLSRKITLEQKKKAVQIAIEGGDVLEYLQQLGSKNPSGLWWTIKNDVKAADPELYAKIPRLDGKKPAEKQEADPQEEKTQDLPMVPEEVAERMARQAQKIAKREKAVPELPKIPDGEEKQEITKPVEYFPKFVEPVLPMKMINGFTVTSIRGKFGEWHMDGKHNSLDFRSADGDEICFRPEAWTEFMEEIRSAVQILCAKN